MKENMKSARDAVSAYFAVYRRFVRILETGEVPREELQAVPGYESAGDPDAIFAPGFVFSTLKDGIDGRLRYMSWFVGTANRIVRGLPTYQEAIIRVQYMGDEQFQNEDAYRVLVERKFYHSVRKFERQRGEAVLSVAEALEYIHPL